MATNSSVNRVGISEKFLAEAGVQQVEAKKALEVCGIEESGLVIPYWTLVEPRGLVPLIDPEDTHYHRLRLKRPRDGRKYHQREGTTVHAYLPPNLLSFGKVEDLVLVEGEFKSLSLTDQEQKYRVPALGLSGFYGFHLKREDGEDIVLLPELETVLRQLAPKRILYLGDNDTAFNYLFYQAAVRLRELLPGVELVLPRIPLDQPKGIDDCRGKLGDKFEPFFRRLAEEAVSVAAGQSAQLLALNIAISALDIVQKMSPGDRSNIIQRIISFAASLPEAQRGEFVKAAKGPSGLGLTELKKRIDQALSRRSEVDRIEVESLVRSKIAGYVSAPRGKYYVKHGSGFREIPGRKDVLLDLKLQTHLSGSPHVLANTELGLNLIQREGGVKWAGPLAGHPAGLRGEGDKRILVTEGTILVPGSLVGDATVIVDMLAELMGRNEEEPYYQQQLTTLLAWLAHRRHALQNPDQHLPAPILVLAGERDIGKDYVARKVITPLIGGREFDPSDIWAGRSPFNDRCFGAEHLLLSDPEVSLDDQKSIRKLKSEMLRAITNEARTLLEKYQSAQHLRPVQAVTVTMNPTGDSLALLPLNNRHAGDKIILLRCHAIQNMPSSDAEQRRQFNARITSALPAFAGQLDAMKAVEDYKSDRFGVTAFQHPNLLAMANVNGKVAKLMGMLDLLVREVNDQTGLHESAVAIHRRLEKRFGSDYSNQFGDARSLGKAFLDIRRDASTWAGRLYKDGRTGYGNHRNYTNVWRIKPAVVGS